MMAITEALEKLGIHDPAALRTLRTVFAVLTETAESGDETIDLLGPLALFGSRTAIRLHQLRGDAEAVAGVLLDNLGA